MDHDPKRPIVTMPITAITEVLAGIDKARNPHRQESPMSDFQPPVVDEHGIPRYPPIYDPLTPATGQPPPAQTFTDPGSRWFFQVDGITVAFRLCPDCGDVSDDALAASGETCETCGGLGKVRSPEDDHIVRGKMSPADVRAAEVEYFNGRDRAGQFLRGKTAAAANAKKRVGYRLTASANDALDRLIKIYPGLHEVIADNTQLALAVMADEERTAREHISRAAVANETLRGLVVTLVAAIAPERMPELL